MSKRFPFLFLLRHLAVTQQLLVAARSGVMVRTTSARFLLSVYTVNLIEFSLL